MANHYIQASLFDEDINDNKAQILDNMQLYLPHDKAVDIKRFSTYNLEKYKNDVEIIGLEETWNNIVAFVLQGHYNSFLTIDKFAELYEIGLAIQDKYAKKESGQYYTPDDVANVMANWFNTLPGENICDVACGTGKLVLTYLDLIGFVNARKILKAGLSNYFLYID